MNRRSVLAFVAVAAIAVPLAATAQAKPSSAGLAHRNTKVCDAAAAGYAACLSVRHDTVDRHGKPVPNATTPSGYGPADIQAAYNLVGT